MRTVCIKGSGKAVQDPGNAPYNKMIMQIPIKSTDVASALARRTHEIIVIYISTQTRRWFQKALRQVPPTEAIYDAVAGHATKTKSISHTLATTKVICYCSSSFTSFFTSSFTSFLVASSFLISFCSCFTDPSSSFFVRSRLSVCSCLSFTCALGSRQTHYQGAHLDDCEAKEMTTIFATLKLK